VKEIVMPSTENNRRNLQQPTLEHPSMPDHDRTKDKGMHEVHAQTVSENQDEVVNPETEKAAPDQEFDQILTSGPAANNGRMPDDPNNWLTSDSDNTASEGDPEDRGVSLPDILEESK
jgi:hypothetical protein